MGDTAYPVCLAAPQQVGQARRALILSGSAARPSYQVGSLLALQEQGLTFQLMNGTSGGSLNMSMLLSGLAPADMAQRWRELKIHTSMAFSPMKEYLKANPLESLSDGISFKEKVLPQLGIDFERIHAVSVVQAGYNLLDYGDKAVEVISHSAINADLLIAGMSLPGVVAPLHLGGKVYLDSGFVQDANLSEAVRQGAEELWVLWGLGNTSAYRSDPLHLYLQMLETSANTALNQQLAAIRELNQRIAGGDSPYGQRRQIQVHIIKPDYPLPLDAELHQGHIDHHNLIDMGYADAKQYLAQLSEAPGGATALNAKNPTSMPNPVPGVRLQLRFVGELVLLDSGTHHASQLNLCLHVHDLEQFIDAVEPNARLTGHLQTTALNTSVTPIHAGQYMLTILSGGARRGIYQMNIPHGDKTIVLVAEQILRDAQRHDFWKDLSTLTVRLYDGDAPWATGDLHLSMPDLKTWLGSIHATDTHSMAESVKTVGRYTKFFLGELSAAYGWHS